MEDKIWFTLGNSLNKDVLDDLIFVDKDSQREPTDEDFDKNEKLVYLGKVYRFVPEDWEAGRLVRWGKISESGEGR